MVIECLVVVAVSLGASPLAGGSFTSGLVLAGSCAVAREKKRRSNGRKVRWRMNVSLSNCGDSPRVRSYGAYACRLAPVHSASGPHFSWHQAFHFSTDAFRSAGGRSGL